MTMETISLAVWGITTTAGIVGVYWKTQNRLQHIEDTKADKNNGLSEVKEALGRIEQKIDDLPCKSPRWKGEDCQ